MSLLTVDTLRRRLDWDRVVREERVQETRIGRLHWVVFSIQPSDLDWPAIDLIFDESGEFIQSVHFSEAHWHHDSHQIEHRNVDAAVRGVAPLVHQRECLVEGLDADGRYCSAEATALDGYPSSIQKRVQQFRRVVFDRPPVIEPVDFTLYSERSYHFVLPALEPRLAIRRQHGWPASPCSASAVDEWQESQVTGHQDGTIRLWELEPERQPVWIFHDRHEGGVTSLAWGPGHSVASGGRDGQVAVWNAETATPEIRWCGHRTPIRRVAWHADQWRVASWSEDDEIRIWNAESQRPIRVLSQREPDRYAAAIEDFFASAVPAPDRDLGAAVEGVWDVQGLGRFELGALDDWREQWLAGL